MGRLARLIATAAVVSAACSGSTAGRDAAPDAADAVPGDVSSDSPGERGTDSGATDGSDGAGDAGGLPAFRSCLDRDLDPGWSGEWRHSTTPLLVTSGGDAGHSIVDAIVTVGSAEADVEGKFAYGLLSVDLEDEDVVGLVDDCTGWVSMGEGRTDSDGRMLLPLPDAVVDRPGRYEVAMVVQGDGSVARGTALVVPPGTAFAVFDIDGTLTTSDSELWSELVGEMMSGASVPEAWPDADRLVQTYFDAGYEVLYLTGRPYLLDGITRGWLDELGFPEGTVRLTRGLGESAPTEDGVGSYKLVVLEEVLGHHRVVHAYGNADTDIFAYQSAGLENDAIFIIGENAGDRGTSPISSYTEHLATLSVPPADQPYAR